MSDDKTKEQMKRERVKAFKENPRTKWVAKNLTKVFLVTNLGLTLTLVASIMWQMDLFFIALLLGAVLFVLTLVFKDLCDQSVKDKVPFHFKSGLLLLVPNLVVYAISSGIEGVFPKGVSVAISFVAGFIAMIVTISLFQKPKFKEGIEGMMEKNIFDEMLGEEIKDGDAVLGVDLETGKPVVLPYADRFLHMLALGATGTGKTAMTLTPMAWRDINNPNMGFTVIEPKGN